MNIEDLNIEDLDVEDMDIENMSIVKRQDEEKLLLKVRGRLDTTTAPRLEEMLKSSLPGVSHLTFDFSSLEYISSAGLRVLLSAHKTMKKQKGAMVVQGANEEVREVFTITGFAEILTVEGCTGHSRKGGMYHGAERDTDEQTGREFEPAAAPVQKG